MVEVRPAELNRPAGLAEREARARVRWCPKCQHPAEAGSRFCSRCGEVLPHRRCESCGTANEVDAWRCVECGQSLRPLARPAPQPGPVDEMASTLGPLARLAEFKPAPAARPGPGTPAHAPGAAAQAVPSTPTLSGAPGEHLSAAAQLAAEALRSTQVIVPEVFERPAPETPPGLRRPMPATPAMPPHLAATLESIARAVAEAPSDPPAQRGPAMPTAGSVAALPAGVATVLPAASLPGSAASAGAAEMVDLFIDLPAPGIQQVDIPLGFEPAPAAFAAPPMSSGQPAGHAMPGRPGLFGRPLVAGAAAGLVLAVLIGLALHWKRLTDPESTPQTARPSFERDVDRRGMPPPPAMPDRESPSATATLPPGASSRGATAGASAAARRGPGVDAAADAALEAAERLLATQPPGPGGSASAPPRPAGRGGG